MPVRAFLDSDVKSRWGVRRGRGRVSMPVRAFLDSDGSLVASYARRASVSMPVRAFLDSDGTKKCQKKKKHRLSFNARQGIS